jgi:DNA repair exonuclease SbcCD ATPase subunit
VTTPFVSTVRAQEQALTAAAQQELARTKFKDLTERMQKLMVALQKSDPEDSKLLAIGLRFAQEKKLQPRLDHAEALLRQERWDESLVVMGELRRDLGTLLELLQNRNNDLRKLLEQINKLEGFKDRVGDLIKEQTEEKDASARTEELQQHLADVEKKKQAAEALLKQQQELRDKTNDVGLDAAADATKPLADREGQLREDTQKLANDLAKTEKKDAELKAAAAKSAKAAGKEPKDGQDKPNGPGQPKDDAGKADEPKDNSSPSGGGEGACSGSAGKAAQAMGQAQKQLGAGKPEPSLKDQDQAIEQLKKTIEQLEEMAEQARRELLKLPFDQQAKKQEQTQHATDTLSKDMEKSEQDGDNGEGQPAPGKKRVQQAVPKQRAAAGQLKEYKPAKQKQQDAKEDLEAAEKELDEALAQLRQQLQDEVLRALEERFTAMLARQRELTTMTKTVDGTRNNILTASGELPAAIAAKIAELAGGETDLESESIDALKLLEEDGTTAVFPPMVEQLRDELHAVADRLRANETADATVQAQKDVEDLLELLINALRKTIERKEGGC